MGGTESRQTLNLTTSYFKGATVDFEKPSRFHTFPDCLQHFAKVKPNREAVVFCSPVAPRNAISWKELYERSSRIAKSFIHLGVKSGENIIVISRNCPEYLYVAFGAMMAGARVINLELTYIDGSDLIKAFDKIKSCALIVLDLGVNEINWNILKGLLDDYDSTGSVSCSKLPFLRKLIFISPPDNEQVKTVEELLVTGEKNESTELPQINPEDIAVVFQTSGSTGIPKFVAHTHANLMSMEQRISSEFNTTDDIFFNAEAFSWAAGLPNGFLIGQTRVTVSGLFPKVDDVASFLIDIIRLEKCTGAALMPFVINKIVKRKVDLPDDWPLKTVFIGGQPITKAVTVCLGTICKNLVVCYGGTEFQTASAMVVNKREDFAEFCCGWPSAIFEVKVVGKDGSVLPVNQLGEIYIRHRFLFKEYFNDPEKTASVMTSDGWYKTDDYGRINSSGYLFVEGRISDMIISDGTNVPPFMLEAVLKSCPGVESAVVVPVPDVSMYQTICACVTTTEGSNVTEVQLRDFVESVHNAQENTYTILPTYYLIMDKFPIGTRGKVSRVKLRKLAEQKFSA